LWLAAVDETALGDAVKWELSRGGAHFPHLYRALNLSEIVWCRALPLEPEGHVFPDDLA